MRYLIALCVLCAGCATPDYDQQFCTVNTDKGCKVWQIGPYTPHFQNLFEPRRP